MKNLKFGASLLGLSFYLIAPLAAADEVKFAKSIIDDRFRSEGVNIADFNKDGQMDITIGEVWYESPDWKAHEVRPLRRLGRTGYTEAFGVYTDDFNQDGWTDIMVIPFHGKDAKWYENPKGKEGHWTERVTFKGTGNETRSYVDLFGTGEKVFLMGVQGQVAWVPVPAPDKVNELWPFFPIGDKKGGNGNPAYKFAHGLGFGDINGDGRNDVMYNGGWFEQGTDARTSKELWQQHKNSIIQDRCAEMYLFDGNLDGAPDVLATSAHASGVYFSQQGTGEKKGKFTQHLLEKKILENHALNYIDINGDGKKDLVTGRRFYAHGYNLRKRFDNAEMLWYEVEAVKYGIPKLTPHLIDSQSGMGTQFVTADFNGDGLVDIITSGRKGVFLFIQYRDKKPVLPKSQSLSGDSAVLTAELLKEKTERELAKKKQLEELLKSSLYQSEIITGKTIGQSCSIDIDLEGAELIVLRVSTEGEYNHDHVDWMEPVFYGPKGTLKLTDLKWESATSGWSSTVLNKSVAGSEMKVSGTKVAFGIGTHAESLITYKVPKGYTHFKAQAGLDESSQGKGKVRFSVHKGKPQE